MPDLRRPFFGDVLEAVWAIDGETHEDHICVWVGEGAESIVVLLTCRVAVMMRGEREDKKERERERMKKTNNQQYTV